MINPFKKAGDTERYLKIAATGPSGSGKTVFGLDAKNHGLGPVYVISLEAGEVLYETHPKWGGYSHVRTQSIPELEQALDFLETVAGGTVVVDTVTGIYEALVEAKAKDDGSVNKNAWGLIKRKWKSIMARLVNLKMNVVYVVHENDIVEEDAKGAFRVVGQKLDAEKSFIRNPDFVVRLLRSADGTRRKAQVLKVRGEQTGLSVGQTVDEPHIGMFAKAVQSGSQSAHVATPDEVASVNEAAMAKKPPASVKSEAEPAAAPHATQEEIALAAALCDACAAGFNAKPHKDNWGAKHADEIKALPEWLRAKVRVAFKAAPIKTTQDTPPEAAAEGAVQ